MCVAGCAGGGTAPTSQAPDGVPPAASVALEDAAPAPAEGVRPLGAEGTYLQPNWRFRDGSVGYAHVTESDMPWVVSIGRPPEPPKYGSTTEAREVAIEAIRMWEAAIQPHVPWFRVEFVMKDRSAPVQVHWERRITGPWGGFGGMSVWEGVGEDAGNFRIGGMMRISTTPSRFTRLELEQVRLLVAHEFGHVLGLGHCLDCDSAMNYSWHTRDRVLVTETDIKTFLALLEQPVGGLP